MLKDTFDEAPVQLASDIGMYFLESSMQSPVREKGENLHQKSRTPKAGQYSVTYVEIAEHLFHSSN